MIDKKRSCQCVVSKKAFYHQQLYCDFLYCTIFFHLSGVTSSARGYAASFQSRHITSPGRIPSDSHSGLNKSASHLLPSGLELTPTCVLKDSNDILLVLPLADWTTLDTLERHMGDANQWISYVTLNTRQKLKEALFFLPKCPRHFLGE